jgi:hypothetical protein
MTCPPSTDDGKPLIATVVGAFVIVIGKVADVLCW